MMITFSELLTEAQIDQPTVDKIIANKKRVSIYYQGDSAIPRGWYTIEAIRSEEVKGKPSLLAFDVSNKNSNSAELKYFDQSKINNWNVLSSAIAKLAIDILKKPKELIKKIKDILKPKVGTAVPALYRGGGGNPKTKLKYAIENKRVVTITYLEIRNKNDNSKPWSRFTTKRKTIKPVAMGFKKVSTKEDGTKDDKISKVLYVRAWQEGEKTQTKEPAWKFFRVDRIQSVDYTGDNFGVEKDEKGNPTPPGPNFNQDGDETMDDVEVIASFKKVAESSLTESILEAIKIF